MTISRVIAAGRETCEMSWLWSKWHSVLHAAEINAPRHVQNPTDLFSFLQFLGIMDLFFFLNPFQPVPQEACKNTIVQ